MKKCVITVVGKDTVGIIAKVCEYLAGTNINILDISQTIVDGYFNMMMIVDVTNCSKEVAVVSKELEEITGRTYSRIHVVGGGSNAGYLNELTAKATGKEVHAGPGEATAIGNITAQMLKAGDFKSVEEARTTIHESFGIKIYK